MGFGYANVGGLRGISMIIYFIWVGILSGIMWEKSIAAMRKFEDLYH
jgi:hypothetical protein